MLTSPRFRRMASIAMMIAAGISTFEPLLGSIGDVRSRFPTNMTGATEVTTTTTGGDVSPEAKRSGSRPLEQGIMGFDHCMHTHGPATVGCAPSWVIVGALMLSARSAPALTSDPHNPPFFHPPRA